LRKTALEKVILKRCIDVDITTVALAEKLGVSRQVMWLRVKKYNLETFSKIEKILELPKGMLKEI